MLNIFQSLLVVTLEPDISIKDNSIRNPMK